MRVEQMYSQLPNMDGKRRRNAARVQSEPGVDEWWDVFTTEGTLRYSGGLRKGKWVKYEYPNGLGGSDTAVVDANGLMTGRAHTWYSGVGLKRLERVANYAGDVTCGFYARWSADQKLASAGIVAAGKAIGYAFVESEGHQMIGWHDEDIKNGLFFEKPSSGYSFVIREYTNGQAGFYLGLSREGLFAVGTQGAGASAIPLDLFEDSGRPIDFHDQIPRGLDFAADSRWQFKVSSPREILVCRSGSIQCTRKNGDGWSLEFGQTEFDRLEIDYPKIESKVIVGLSDEDQSVEYVNADAPGRYSSKHLD